jgi:hypothetical protein
MKQLLAALICSLALIPAAFAQADPELVCWEFASQIIPCDGVERGAEFGVGLPAAIPSWVPSPLKISEMHLTYFEYPGGPTVPLQPQTYGAISANTDPDRAWLNAGCSPQSQTCPISIGVDLGKLFIRPNNPNPYKQFKFSAPAWVRSTDGLVLGQICYGGGHIQAIWDFCWVKP